MVRDGVGWQVEWQDSAVLYEIIQTPRARQREVLKEKTLHVWRISKAGV